MSNVHALRIAVLLVISLALWSCSEIDEPCPIDDMEIIRFAVSGSYEDSGYTVVHPTTNLDEWEGESQMEKLQTLELIVERLNLDGCDESRLVWRLFARNETETPLTLPSAPEQGFIVDYDSTYFRYFMGCTARDGWRKWRENHPKAVNSTTVSLPVYDADCGVILIYRSTVMGALYGGGWVIAIQVTDSTLVKMDSARLWIS